MGVEKGDGGRDRLPYNLVFDLAKTRKESKSVLPNVTIRRTYLNWAEQLLNQGALALRPPRPFPESFERPLFEVFCEQLKYLGAEVSREDRKSILSVILGDLSER